MNKLQLSDDGSHTIYSEKFDATYHSTHGSIQEAQTVFIEAGLNYFKNKKNISILEMGFGSGLNLLMTINESLVNKKEIEYHSIEKYPISITEVKALNFCDQLELNRLKPYFEKCHIAESNETIRYGDSFHFKKFIEDINKILLPMKYDIIYYDAFGPKVQPQLWEEAIMQKMFDTLNEGGILVTYCAMGSFKRALKKVGFKVEGLPGPIGKREMTRAIKLGS